MAGVIWAFVQLFDNLLQSQCWIARTPFEQAVSLIWGRSYIKLVLMSRSLRNTKYKSSTYQSWPIANPHHLINQALIKPKKYLLRHKMIFKRFLAARVVENIVHSSLVSQDPHLQLQPNICRNTDIGTIIQLRFCCGMVCSESLIFPCPSK